MMVHMCAYVLPPVSNIVGIYTCQHKLVSAMEEIQKYQMVRTP